MPRPRTALTMNTLAVLEQAPAHAETIAQAIGATPEQVRKVLRREAWLGTLEAIGFQRVPGANKPRVVYSLPDHPDKEAVREALANAPVPEKTARFRKYAKAGKARQTSQTKPARQPDKPVAGGAYALAGPCYRRGLRW